MGVRRDLLEQVRLAGAPGAELDGVVVRHDERDHAGEQDVLLRGGVNRVGSKPTLRSSRSRHCVEGEPRPPCDERVEGVAGRHLDGPHRLDPEGLAARLLAERGDVLEGDLGVEAAGEHPVVLVDQLVGDVDVAELEARQLGLVGVGLGVEPGPEQVDDLDPALLAGARLEQLLLAGAHRALLHRALDDREALGDLVRVGRGAVPAEQELADVGRHRVLAAELLGQVLADQVALEHLGRELVELVELAHRFLPTTTSRWARICPSAADEHEVGALALVLLVGHDAATPCRRSMVSFASSAMLVFGVGGQARGGRRRHLSADAGELDPAQQPEPLDLRDLRTARRSPRRAGRDREPRDDALLRAHPAVLVLLVRLEAGDARARARCARPDPRTTARSGRSTTAPSFRRAQRPFLTSVGGRRQLDLLHAARQQHPAVVGHDVDPLPAGVEQLADAGDDPVDLLVEVVDEPDADVVAAVVDLAGLRPRRSRRVTGLGRSEDLHAVVGHERSQHLDRRLGAGRRVGRMQVRARRRAPLRPRERAPASRSA